MKLLAVPNVSEGRDFERLDRLQDSLGVEVVLLDRHADIDHNRAVFTIAGPPGDVEKALTGLAAAGRYKPNAFGAYDVIGNAREWLQDCYTASYKGRPSDGRAWTWQGGCELKSVRGGSWASRPLDARAAARDVRHRARDELLLQPIRYRVVVAQLHREASTAFGHALQRRLVLDHFGERHGRLHHGRPAAERVGSEHFAAAAR